MIKAAVPNQTIGASLKKNKIMQDMLPIVVKIFKNLSLLFPASAIPPSIGAIIAIRIYARLIE